MQGRIVSIGKNANRFIHCYGGDLKLETEFAVYPHIAVVNAPAVTWICVCEYDDDLLMAGLPYQNNPDVPNTNPELYPHFMGGFGEYATYTRKPLCMENSG